jgi:type III pantothenate kinase
MSNSYFKVNPLIVGSDTKTGLSILYDNPKDVGADRIANAVAGHVKFGGPLIIVDFGTAITFDVVSKKGEYLGGLIFPGVSISMEALFNKAAKLPRVELISPTALIGKSTSESIQAGAVYGYTGLVDNIVKKIQKETGKETKIISTGGQAYLIAKHSSLIQENCPLLTLDGLKIIYDKNNN